MFKVELLVHKKTVGNDEVYVPHVGINCENRLVRDHTTNKGLNIMSIRLGRGLLINPETGDLERHGDPYHPPMIRVTREADGSHSCFFMEDFRGTKDLIDHINNIIHHLS